ncbi:MAG: GNAT family N-acetyltransferase [Anaerolineae bacterium]|nr:GNAT family N-acetyltransferase [Anaerolineae bacterium]
MDPVDLLEVVEQSMLALPAIPGKIEVLDIPGVRARRTPPVAHPLTNLIGAARSDTDHADAMIQQVCAVFMPRRETFGWFVDESSTPPDLGERLGRAGLNKVGEIAGLVLDDLSIRIDTNPKVSVRRAVEADRHNVVRLYTQAYPCPEPMAHLITDAITLLGGHNYLAFVEGEAKPVAVASMYYWPTRPIVALQGAATLDAFRGQGIYTALMAVRLRDAQQDGIQAAAMQSDRNTSAPICLKLGFREITSIAFYVWSPD